MKKILLLCLLAFSLLGCQPASQAEQGEMTKKKVAATTTFVADIIEKIAGDTVDINQIMPAGEDPHLYVAKPGDYKVLEQADLVLYHGLHFEGKMVDVLEQLGHALAKDFPKDKLLEMVEEDNSTVVDPHFWFNLDLYVMAVQEATNQLVSLNPEHKDLYEKNSQDYIAQVKELKDWATKEISQIPRERRILITPHDAFGYFSKQFDIDVMAPQGVSTDSEVSNVDILSTIDYIVEHKVKAIFTETTTDPARMEKLKEGAAAKGFEITVVKDEKEQLLADSLAPKGQEGDTFLDMVRHNVNIITKYLK